MGQPALLRVIRALLPDSFGIDHQVKHPKSQVICLDLQKPEVQEMVMQWASDPKCVWVHFGVPCGTASRARERRMSKAHFGPRPMRSKQYPDGLPPHLLNQNSRDRLRAANRFVSLYAEAHFEFAIHNSLDYRESPPELALADILFSDNKKSDTGFLLSV